MLKNKDLKTLLIHKSISKNSVFQEKMLFSLPEIVSDKKICVDFDAPDMSSNGGLVLLNGMRTSIAWKRGKLIPDVRKQEFIHHTYPEMVSQRVGQKKKADMKPLDLCLVVGMFLTGFDSKKLNTLYVDKNIL